MPFIGFSFDKIEAERNVNEIKGDINVKHTLNIVDLKEEQISIDKKQDVLKFMFEFLLKYEPSIGEIKLNGHLLYTDDPKKIKEIQAKWKKDKKIEPELMSSLFNMILTKSNIKSLSLSQDVNLPPHLPMPRLQPQSKTNLNEYIG